jgi:hypothetical protein
MEMWEEKWFSEMGIYRLNYIICEITSRLIDNNDEICIRIALQKSLYSQHWSSNTIHKPAVYTAN